MNLISGINATSSALNAEKIRMNIVTENIANARTTHDVDGGGPYQRKIVSFESVLNGVEKSVRVSGVTTDSTPGETIYNPAHPDADQSGMVHMPNVNLAMEMVDLMNSSRAYEANLSVVRNAKQLALQSLNIGK
jgi:flagellar basal-body rod protein FlgC